MPGAGYVRIGHGLVPVPFNVMLCVAPLALRLLSVKINDPVSEPTLVGEKLMGSKQDAPPAKVPGEEALDGIRGQAEVTLLFNVNFVEMLGFFPAIGIGKVRAALPLLTSVTVCGLSLLVEPMFVGAKVSDGASA